MSSEFISTREYDVPEHAPKSNGRLAGLVVAVFGGGATGDGVGVGQACSVAYGLSGARVAVIDNNDGNAHRSCDFIRSMGGEAFAVHANITKVDSVSSALTAVVDKFGAIDVVQNTVGSPKLSDFDKFTEQDWLSGFQLNCLGAANTMHCAIPYFLKSGGGRIINISSIAGIRHTGMNYAIYSATKAALNQLTVAVAIEYAAAGIRANAILPGLLDTSMGRSLGGADSAEAKQSRAKRSPTGFQGDSWDVANAGVFLASAEARFINGHLLIVDGGMSARC